MEITQYQLLPDLTTDEYAALKADIAKRGVMVPVEYDELGNVLDGHHRARACQELGITEWPRLTRLRMSEQEKTEHVLALNLDRRHLTREQRQELVAKLRAQGWSTTRIAKQVHVSHPTVLNDLSGCKNLQPEMVIGKDGKQYPARQKPKPVSLFNASAQEVVKAKAVVDSGDDELIAQMDKTGKVNGAWKNLRAHLFISQSNSNEWYTPRHYVEAARAVMGGIDCDPASSAIAQGWIGATTYHTIEDDGLAHDWQGRIWLNPPWGRLTGNFIAKLETERRAGHVTEAVVLVNAHATDTQWFVPLWDGLLCFTDHRINYISPGDDDGAGSTHGSIFVYFGPNGGAFIRTFSQWGTVVRQVSNDD